MMSSMNDLNNQPDPKTNAMVGKTNDIETISLIIILR